MVSGWFEWTPDKQPYAFKRTTADKGYIFIAGLIMNDNSVIILTKEVEPNLNHVHHRMPLLIDEEKAMDAWLDPNLKFVDVIGTVMNKDNKVFRMGKYDY